MGLRFWIFCKKKKINEELLRQSEEYKKQAWEGQKYNNLVAGTIAGTPSSKSTQGATPQKNRS